MYTQNEHEQRVFETIKDYEPIGPFSLHDVCRRKYLMDTDFLWKILLQLNEKGKVTVDINMNYVTATKEVSDDKMQLIMLPIVEKLTKIRTEIGFKRDELADLVDEIDSLRESSDEATDDLERAIDALSRYA